MTEPKWARLLLINDRLKAEIFQGALEAQGITAMIFQEGIAHYAYPSHVGALATVEICVLEEQLGEAQAWLDTYAKGELNDNDFNTLT